MTHQVAVIGAGVSGCATALVLAEAGLAVLLVNSGLDVVGLPAYGPDLLLERGSNVAAGGFLEGLPPRLRDAWLAGARLVEGHPQLALVDRRAVSLRTKWLLESVPSLSMRQALVTSIRSGPPSDAQVSPANQGEEERRLDGIETDAPTEVEVTISSKFGEAFRAEFCVIAVGLAMRGRIRVGHEVLPGGRYGEVAADELGDQLAALGVPLSEVSRRVGSRLLPPGAEQDPARSDQGPLLEVQLSDLGYEVHDPDAFKGETEVPSPYDEIARMPAVSYLWREALEAGSSSASLPLKGVLPDGHAGGQWYGTPGMQNLARSEGWIVVQPEHEITGSIALVSGGYLGQHGLPNVWVTGQAAGADTYLASLRSGVETARAVLRAAEKAAPAFGLNRD